MALCTSYRVAEAEAPERLTTVTGWRRVGREVWEAAGVFRPIEQIPLRRAPGERSGRHLKPGRRPASVRHVCRTEEASGHPAPGQPPAVRHIRRIGGRRNVQRRRCRNRGPGRRLPRAESTSRYVVLKLQGEDGGTEDSDGSRIYPREGPTCQRGPPGPGGPSSCDGPPRDLRAKKDHLRLQTLREPTMSSEGPFGCSWASRGSLRKSVNPFIILVEAYRPFLRAL